MGILDALFGRKKTPRPDFTNVRSGGSSTTTAPSAGGAPPVIPTSAEPIGGPHAGGTYVVVSGDSLSKIAKHEYGNANMWQRIYEANRDLIKNPDLIYPGQKLTIPRA